MVPLRKRIYQRKRVVGGRMVFTLHTPTTGGMARVVRTKRNGRTYYKKIGGSRTSTSQSQPKRPTISAAASILKSLSKRGGSISRLV